MAIRNFAKTLLAAVFAVACTVEQPQEAPIISEPLVSVALPSVVLELDDDLLPVTKASPVGERLEDLGIVALTRVFPDAGEYEPRTREMGLHRFYRAEFSLDTPATKAAASLEDLPGVRSATPSRKVYRRGFNDPYYSYQWNIDNVKYPLADIHVKEVWERYTTGSSNVIVSVVDECVDATHEDLQGNLWKDASGHTGRNFAKDNWDLSISATEDDGHGTHVAGIIAAVNNNGKFFSSIAGGDKAAGKAGVKIMSCAIFSGEDSADDDQCAEAIKWGADHGAVISQNSWGYTADGILDGKPDGTVSQEEYEAYLKFQIPPVLQAAIDYFIEKAGCDNSYNQLPDSPMQGGLVFFAAGNEGDQDIDYEPICNYAPVISVGAFGENGHSAYYSNYGDWVDIAAPGGGRSATSTDYVWGLMPVMMSDEGVAGMVGTSQACPHASGVAALIISYFGGQGFTAGRCREILFGGLGEKVGGNRPVGRRLNALASFEYGISGGDFVVSLSGNNFSVKAHETVTVTVTVMGGNGVILTCEPGSKALSFDASTRKAVIVGKNAPASTYAAVFTAKDNQGRTTSATLYYSIEANHAPTVVSTPKDILFQKLQASQTLPISDVFRDPDGEKPTVSASFSQEGIVSVASTSEGDIALSAIGYGLTEVTLTGTDVMGASAKVTFRVAVIQPDVQVTLSPSLVSTEAYVAPASAEPVKMEAKVYSFTGALVLSQEGEGSVFSPLRLDVSALAPGRYTVDVTYSGNTHRVKMVKY